jgi:hypothetical protein
MNTKTCNSNRRFLHIYAEPAKGTTKNAYNIAPADWFSAHYYGMAVVRCWRHLEFNGQIMISTPDFLSHYYEAAGGPFRNLSDLPEVEAEAVLQQIRMAGDRFASQRTEEYLAVRRGLEEKVRALFTAKGGSPKRERPHYLIVGECPWLKSWYRSGCELRIPLTAFNAENVSFTYGDTFPAMRYQDGKPYRGQVYTLAELPGLIEQYGLPQVWNADGKHGPDRYVEAQVWTDEPLFAYLGLAPHLGSQKKSA